MKALGLSFSTAFILAACSTAAPPASPVDTTVLPTPGSAVDDTLSIPLGGSATTRNGGLRVSYRALESDSRCPANVVCVWAGDAATKLRLQTSSNVSDATVHTTLDPRALEFGGYTISLLEVQPYPGAGPATARVVVRVVK